MFIKRYELVYIKEEDTFYLQYKDEKIKLNVKNWEDAEDLARRIIHKMQEENKEPNTYITWG